MQFNADTRKFEGLMGITGNGKAGNFGFDEGSREDLWMSITHQHLMEKYGPGDEGDKKKRREAEGRVATLFNRAYDFMFWCDEKKIEFYPTDEQRPTITTVKGDNSFELKASLHSFPIDEARRRMELDFSIPLILGPMEPLQFDEDTGECIAWMIKVAPWRPDKEIENAITTLQKEEAMKQHFHPTREHTSERDWMKDTLDGVTIVNEGVIDPSSYEVQPAHPRSLLPQ